MGIVGCLGLWREGASSWDVLRLHNVFPSMGSGGQMREASVSERVTFLKSAVRIVQLSEQKGLQLLLKFIRVLF